MKNFFLNWFRGITRARTAVIMRTKDRPVFLRRGIESVLRQSDQNFVLVVVNDGGDRTVLENTLAPFRQRLAERLVVVHFDKPEGRGKGIHINRGILATDSEFIAIHDDDDSWHPDFLRRMIAAAEHQPAVVCFSDRVVEKVSADGTTIEEVSRSRYEPWLEHAIPLFRLAESLFFPPIALLFRRTVLSEIGPFADHLGPLEDWDFALRLCSRHEVPLLEEVLANYHIRDGGLAGSTGNSAVNSKKVYGVLDAQIRNHYLREDLKKGQQGLGFLLNLSKAHGDLYSEILNKRS